MICWNNQKKLRFLLKRNFKNIELDVHEDICFNCFDFEFVKKIDDQHFAYTSDLFVEIISVVKS